MRTPSPPCRQDGRRFGGVIGVIGVIGVDRVGQADGIRANRASVAAGDLSELL